MNLKKATSQRISNLCAERNITINHLAESSTMI